MADAIFERFYVKNMVKVSIIIPIYNAEKYLNQCIESVLCQTMKELEIICIDDGSTDHSLQIIEQFRKDIRIRLFQQKNQGAGVARNFALEKAEGKYVAFLDADDYYINTDALELMFNACEKNGLFACAALRKHIIDGGIEPSLLFQDADKGKILDYQNYQIDYDYQNFIFLREIILENKIYFPNYRRFQDPPFLVKILYEIKRFMLVDTYLYCYRETNMEMRFNSRNTYDLLCGLIDNLNFAKEKHLEILFRNTVFRLEYEYRNIILKNIDLNDLGILKLLMQANQIICYQTGKTNYIIKPLRMILLYADQYEKKLLRKIRGRNKIVLYGAGRYGRAFLCFLKRNCLQDRVEYIIVSDLKGNESNIENIPVITLHKLQEIGEKPMYVTVGKELQAEIKRYLDWNHYQGYEIIEDEFLYAISGEVLAI